MNMILKLGASALTVGMAITAAGCAKSGAATPTAGETTAGQPSAHSATAISSPHAHQNAEDKMPRVKVEDAKKLVAEGKAIIIDVRGADAYKMSHIKGALDFPLTKIEAGDFKDLPTDKVLIAYCGWPSEHTSARAAFLLQQKGFKDAGALLGGISAWEASGGPMEKATPTATPSKNK